MVTPGQHQRKAKNTQIYEFYHFQKKWQDAAGTLRSAGGQLSRTVIKVKRQQVKSNEEERKRGPFANMQLLRDALEKLDKKGKRVCASSKKERKTAGLQLIIR